MRHGACRCLSNPIPHPARLDHVLGYTVERVEVLMEGVEDEFRDRDLHLTTSYHFTVVESQANTIGQENEQSVHLARASPDRVSSTDANDNMLGFS